MIEVYTDGRAEPNPGTGTFGFVVHKDGRRVGSRHGQVGRDVTNNYAEYFCLLEALDYLSADKDEEVTIYSDSALLVNQMNGKWKFKKGAYGNMYLKAREAAGTFSKIKFVWIPRERNAEADELTNLAFSEAKVYEERRKR